jgi:hypothetical protein
MSTMAEVIAAHQPGNMSRERYCTCGAFIGDWATLEDLAAHVAAELTRAGCGDQHQAWDEGRVAGSSPMVLPNPYPKEATDESFADRMIRQSEKARDAKRGGRS